MPADTPQVRLTMSDLRAVAGFAAACARPVLAIFEAAFPDDPRPQSAVDAVQAFADGSVKRTKALRDAAWSAMRSAHAARDAGRPAAAEAARAALTAAGSAYLHPLFKATQVKHVLGSAAHAARAFELAADGEAAVGDAYAVRLAATAREVVADVLRRYPPAPAGGGRVGALVRLLDALVRETAGA